MLKVNKSRLRPYGDRLDDGVVQLSFTLPVPASPEAAEAAKRYASGLGLKEVSIAAMEPMGESFAYFVIYGVAKHTVDITKIKVPKVQVPYMKFEDLKEYMARNIDRPIVVVGACTGSDAHTVGIDAIMNMKGYDHDYGLERYPLFDAHNLRSQLDNEKLVEHAAKLNADVVLVSQIVTQRGSHMKNLKELRDLMKRDKKIPNDVIVIIGGPRLDHSHALKLGFDAGFGPGTKPSQVASFIVHEYMKRHGIKERPDKVEKDKTPRRCMPAHRVERQAEPSADKPAERKPSSKRRRRGKRGGRNRRSKRALPKG